VTRSAKKEISGCLYLAMHNLTCGTLPAWSSYTLNIAALFRGGFTEFVGGFQKSLLGCTLYSRRLKSLLTELFSQPLYFDTDFPKPEIAKEWLIDT